MTSVVSSEETFFSTFFLNLKSDIAGFVAIFIVHFVRSAQVLFQIMDCVSLHLSHKRRSTFASSTARACLFCCSCG